MKLYPLKFKPVFCYRIWGGEKLKTRLNKNYTADKIGESWEISGIPGMETYVSNGPLKGKALNELITTFQHDLVGSKNYSAFGNDFPLLIKFIDAKTPLSVQVHPNNLLARQRHNCLGKNEMWYIMQADDDAELIVGFDRPLNEQEYSKHLENETILDVLNIEKVTQGDTYYIPTGRVHAIGAGVLLAEIQQTSDITYRIYDYNRIDSKTNAKRELHTDLALKAIDFHSHTDYKTPYSVQWNSPCNLVHSPYFKTDIIDIVGEFESTTGHLDSFVIYICVEGSAMLSWGNECYHLNMGETILIPASIQNIRFRADAARILQVYL